MAFAEITLPSTVRPDLNSKAVILSSDRYRRIKHVNDTGAPDLDGLMKESTISSSGTAFSRKHCIFYSFN